LFPLGGPSSLASFVGASLDSGLLPIVGAELPLADYTISGGGFVADDVLTRVIGLATGLGVNRFVVPANAPARVRVVAQQILSTGKDPALYLPGIGELGGTIQAAFEAAAGARTYAIIGRAIYAAANRAEAANRLAGEALERGQ
jgi:orotidine-5'-phosphate decarboxylase